ncbi:MAG: acetyl-CoA acetyltransferase [Acidimicrobiales bacterium]
MALDPRTPVLIGAGQVVQRAAGLDDALDPVALMADAARAAATDAGLHDVPLPDSIRVVSLLSWRYRDPAVFLAEDLGFADRVGELAYTTAGGNTPQMLVNVTADEIQRGQLDLAILAGAETWRTRMRARRADATLNWRKMPEDHEPQRVIGADTPMGHPSELAKGIVMPVQVYPMFESAIRAARGESLDEHQVKISELWARFSAVAATNPYAWVRQAKTAEEIRVPTADNRIIGFPYPKLMNSNNDVDQAAALIVCSVAKARELGVPEDRWVFIHAGTECHDHDFVSNRADLHSAPAVKIGGRRALDLAGIGVDDIAYVDLYSCFPSAVQMGADALGLSLDAPLTRTGGLAFAGGPWNNYVMHAIATVMAEVRADPGSFGFCWANGGFATKHAFGVYSTTPPAAFRHENPQAEIDALPRRELADGDDAAGPATIEAYTVMHSREGQPEFAIAAGIRPDGRRTWATSNDVGLCAALCDGEWVGDPMTIESGGLLRIA